MPRIVSEASLNYERAGTILREGGLVAFPTETVYGLGANALNKESVSRIFEAKGRPSFNPLITHFSDANVAANFAVFDQRAQIVAEHFWPGPLTLILPRRSECTIADSVSAGLDTLAVRIPAHPVAQKLLKAAAVPICAPSANRSGSVSPTTPAHVAQSLEDNVDLIIAAGKCTVGLESTVLDLSGSDPVIVRPGSITAEALEEILGCPVTYAFVIKGKQDKPRSPGLLLKHYAPNIPVRLNAVDVAPGEALLAFGSVKFMGVQGGGHAKDMAEGSLLNLSKNADLEEAAANLFAMLRQLDNPAYKRIAVMNIPDNGIGIAINERLKRAAQSSE